MKTRILLLALAIATLASCRKEPVACFNTDPASSGTIYIGTEISFDNCSTDEQNAVWDFGDGTSSSERSPKHTYAVKGEYTVTLTAYSKGDMKKDVATKVLSIHTLGLVAYYPFNGNADDESGNGNDGTVNGATLTTDRFGNENRAYWFDGIDDSIAISGVANEIEEDITLAAWVNLPSKYMWNNYGLIIWKEGGYWSGTLGMRVGGGQQVSGHNQFVVSHGTKGSSTFTVAEGSVIADSTWHHIAYASDGLTGRLYVDGDEKTTHTADIAFESGDTWQIAHGLLKGTIDEVRIYNIALNASEILELYQQ